MSELPFSMRPMPGSNTTPGLFGVTPPMLPGPSAPPSLIGEPAGTRERDHVMHLRARLAA